MSDKSNQSKKNNNKSNRQRKVSKKKSNNADEDSSIEEEEMEDEGEQEMTESEKLKNDKSQAMIQFDQKHRSGRAKWTVPENFPDPRVCHTYLHPMTNQENEKFLWKYPNLSKVRSYCQQVLGWTEMEMDSNVDPVIKRFMEKTIQTRIDQHFLTYQDDTRFARIGSERLKTAVVQITGKSTNLALVGPAKRKTRKSKTTAPTTDSSEGDKPGNEIIEITDKEEEKANIDISSSQQQRRGRKQPRK